VSVVPGGGRKRRARLRHRFNVRPAIFSDTKPKLKSHYRAHRLSFWLNLVPELHKPGDDVPYSHHMFQSDLHGVTTFNKPVSNPR